MAGGASAKSFCLVAHAFPALDSTAGVSMTFPAFIPNTGKSLAWLNVGADLVDVIDSPHGVLSASDGLSNAMMLSSINLGEAGTGA